MTVRAQSSSIGQPHKYGLMIEVDGVLVDIHKDCHRVAFNQAFEVSLAACYVSVQLNHGAWLIPATAYGVLHGLLQELGMDCVAWTPSVYHDLLRSGDGTAEGIVAAYFGMVRLCISADTAHRHRTSRAKP